jgi:hypothetical protein
LERSSSVDCRILLCITLIVILAAHLSILGDSSASRLPAHDSPTHATRDQRTNGHKHGSSKYDVRAPGHVWYKKQDINQEGKQGHYEGDQAENKE